MVDILPFNGLIYNKEKIGDISKVVSPPYDVVTEKARRDLISCSRENIVNLTLPDGEGDLKYANASRILTDWINEHILIYDSQRCFYGLEICFKEKGALKKLTGFIGLTRIEEYETGKILRHEKTLSGPKKDRYRLLESCRTNFGLIYTIYRDNGKVRKILDPNLHKKPFTSISPCYDKDLRFNMWKISDPNNIDKICSAMSGIPILIADGHHRYETSLDYRNNIGQGSVNGRPEDYVLTLFVDSAQEELKIYPTHRRVNFNKSFSIDTISQALGERFEINTFSVKNGSGVDNILEDLRKNNKKGFIFYLREGACILTLKSTHPDFDTSRPDIFILHEDVLRSLDDEFEIIDISFNHEADQIIDDIKSGSSDLGIFLNPPSIQDMESICYSGGLMPQKSTYFWPKPCTGLVMYKL